MLKDRAAIQEDTDRMEEWAAQNHPKFNKDKCKVLYLGEVNPLQQNMLPLSG